MGESSNVSIFSSVPAKDISAPSSAAGTNGAHGPGPKMKESIGPPGIISVHQASVRQSFRK